MSGFSLMTIVSEASRNAFAARGWLALSAVTALISCAFVTIAPALEVQKLQARFQQYVAAGAFVAVVEDPLKKPLPAEKCERLTGVAGVAGSGGIISRERIRSSLARSVPIELIIGTQGLPDVIWPSPETKGADPRYNTVAGFAVGERFGLQPGSKLGVRGESGEFASFPIGAVAQASARGAQYDSALMATVATAEHISQCVVEAEPAAAEAIGNLLVGWFGREVAVSALTSGGLKGIPSESELDMRITAALPYLAGAACGIVFGLGVLGRRADFAQYKLLGIRRTQLSLLVLVEFGVAVLVPAASGMLLALSWLTRDSQLSTLAAHAAVYDASIFLGSLWLMPLLMLGVVARGAPAEVLRGR